MAGRIKDMTEGSPLRLIFSFALPLMIGNVFQQMYTVVDTMVVGKALGVSALAALGATDWLNWLVLGLIQGLTQGFAILMAREFGARNFDNLRRVIGCSAVLSLICAVAFLIVGQALARPLLLFLQTPEEAMGGALLYLRIMYMGIPIVMAYNLLACILRALGDGQTPLNAMIVASFVNIALDLLFVLVFHWGIAGAAVATLLAQVFSSLFCLNHIRKLEILAMQASDFKVQLPMAKQLLFLGFPVASQNGLIALGGLVVQFVVNKLGVIFIAGYTATNKLFGILEIAASSYGFAMVTYVGQNMGAGKPKRIRKGVRAAVVIAIATSLLIAAAMILFGKSILMLFISGTPEEVAQTMRIAYYYLVLMSVCLPVLYVLHVTRSTVQGMGNTVLAMASGIGELVMRLLAAAIMPTLIPEMGILYSEVLAWAGAVCVLIPSYLVNVRKMEQKMLIHSCETV